MARELRVDWLRCDGYGLCGDLAPDAIGLDDWRYPVILEGALEPGLLDDVQRAIDCCPMHALRLVDSGTTRRDPPVRVVDGSSAPI
jgi:ferredoxin